MVVYDSQAPDGIVFDSEKDAICQQNFEILLKEEAGLLIYTLTFWSACHKTKDNSSQCKMATIK